MEPFIAYILALMIAASPIKETQTWGGITETREEKQARFKETAQQLAEVIRDAKHLPYDPYMSAAAAVAIWQHESALALAVDKGLGKHGRGDAGRSFCMAQIQLGTKKTKEGWSGEDLLEDRKKCFALQIRYMAGSVALCTKQGMPPEHALSSYTMGICFPDKKSKIRFETAHKLARKIPRPKGPAFPPRSPKLPATPVETAKAPAKEEPKGG